MIKHPQCQAWIERSQDVLAGGPATLSKCPSRYATPLAPSVLVSGTGAFVTCADGEVYIDTVAALGPVILGHSDAAVNLAVYKQIDAMACSTLTTPLETEVAEMLCAIIPGAEQVRFATNGKDVTEAAIKLARHVTGKRHVVYCGYHGGFSDYLITTDKAGGLLPSLSNFNHQVPWRDFEALDHVINGCPTIPARNDLAAIILEVPPELPFVLPAETAVVLRRYADMAHTLGALFILDEIVTGLRYAIGGAQEYYGVQADLVTISKALGNGHAIAALMGQRDLMQEFEGGKVFLSTTFGGNPIGLAAAHATINELQSKSHGRERLETWGTMLYRQLQEAMAYHVAPCTLRGNFARMVLDWHDIPGIATAAQLHTLWLQETAKRGVLFGVPIFPMTCYEEAVVDQVMKAVKQALEFMTVANPGDIEELLEVPVISDVFQRYASVKESA